MLSPWSSGCQGERFPQGWGAPMAVAREAAARRWGSRQGKSGTEGPAQGVVSRGIEARGLCLLFLPKLGARTSAW